MIIRFEDFKGMMPGIAAKKLPPNAAQVAANIRFGSGALRPWNQPSFVNTPAKSGTKKSIFRYGNPSTGKWFHWLEDVNICLSAVASDGFDRVYWTGEGVPKYTVNFIATAGGTQYPTNSYTLGIPAPVSAPTAAVTGTATSTDPTEAESRSYVYNYNSAYGEAGPPSPPSNTVVVYPGQSVSLTGMSTAPAGSYNIATKDIFRTNTGSSSTEYQYVGSVVVATTSLSDTVASDSLGEVLPSTGWIAPNAGMKGLISHPGGFLVGFYDNVLCFSEPYMPHAWPAEYQIVFDNTIVAIGAFGSSILVTTTGMPRLVTGDNPATIGKPEELEKGEACVSKRGFVDLGYACAYPGPSGMWIAGTGQIELVTAGILSQKEWEALDPASMLATQYENNLIMFTSTGSYILDLKTGDFTTIGVTATAAWYDREHGKLFLQVGNDIIEWCGADTYYTLIWKSKPVQVPSPTNLGAGQVLAASYPVTLKVYADGVLKHTQTVANGEPFRLPSGFRAVYWEAEVSGISEITSILLASTMNELAQV